MADEDIQIDPGSIVLAVDGSEHADRAARWAAAQAALEHRPVVVVCSSITSTVWPGSVEGAGAYATPELLDAARTLAEESAATVRSAAPDVPVKAMATRGDPRITLIDLSENAHLIVMGSRGRGTMRSTLLGSVSASVSKRARCPVVVCRPPADDATPHGIVVGADGTPESLPVLEFAFEQASLRDQPLTIVHSYRDIVIASAGLKDWGGEQAVATEVEELRAMLSESTSGLTQRFPDVSVTEKVELGLVDHALQADDANWDLIVVGRHPVDSFGRMLIGSIATTVLERADAPVAVVPEAATTSD